jgi:hypothetical protein
MFMPQLVDVASPDADTRRGTFDQSDPGGLVIRASRAGETTLDAVVVMRSGAG